jgi:polyvinyl alcohol dehydrogenase (cytochrome)
MASGIRIGGIAAALLAMIGIVPMAGAAAPAPAADAPWQARSDSGSAEVKERGAAVFAVVCSQCHDHAVAQSPARYLLSLMSPAMIYRALTDGAMKTQGSLISDEDRRAVAQFLTGQSLRKGPEHLPPGCAGNAAQFDFKDRPAFPAWGLTQTNTRAIDGHAAGLNRANVGRLHLKWAIGFDDSARVRSQPALAGGALYIGTDDGRVFAFDRASGCRRWAYQAGAEVRTGIVVSDWAAGRKTAHPRVYFGDVVGNVYALDAVDGTLVWQDRTDAHGATTLTAAPTLYGGRLYVGVSSLEEAQATGPYPCCTFRGSVIAYDARTGKRNWQRFMTAPPQRLPATKEGDPARYGPAGIAIWNTPSIDAKRGVLYVGTGDNYTSPTTEYSDSILALDLKTGRVRWHFQATQNDAWNVACAIPGDPLCPADNGPDHDFGAATILARSRAGHSFVVAGQKSGWVYALDPRNGRLAWKSKVGRGGIMAGVYFGMAVVGDRLYVPISDAPDGRTYTEAAKPGLYALDLETGKPVWQAPNDAATCRGLGSGCDPGISAAVSATDELVISGASDGWVRLYDSRSGQVLWSYDTKLPVPALGGGTAVGGSIGGGAGPIASKGLLFVESGYGFAGRMPGNALMVFGID